MPLAYFITFSTYGTWLHGTSKGKGSVDRTHNRPGTPFVSPDADRFQRERASMNQPAYVLDKTRRDIVRDAIIDISTEKGCDLLGLHVRTNHVHVVIRADREPGRLMSDLKARASKDLNHADLDPRNRKRWTRHGSTIHLFTPEKVNEKIHYTIHEQGIMMAWYKKETANTKDPRTK